MEATQKGSLIRILRNDTPDLGKYVLLHITPTSSSQPLNLQLHATDGERAFGLKLKQSKIDELRAKSYTGTVSELELIFSSLLLKNTITDPQLTPRGVELAASAGGDYVTLTIRQDIGGIKQRIAALKIPEVEDDIPIFEWAVGGCGAIDESAAALQSLQSRVALQEAELTKLSTQLANLVALKQEHEEILLVKFSELLNAKKSKIRTLNQLLEATPAASTPAAASTSPPAEPAEPKPQPTTRKRKPVAPLSDSESDGFVKMDVDKGAPSAAPADDETEDSEDSDVGALKRGYIRPNAASDRSATEDEDELPPPRKPFEAFTLRKETPETGVETQTQAGDEVEEPKANRGRGGRARGRGRGRGRGRVAVTVKEPSPEVEEGSGGDTGDDEL